LKLLHSANIALSVAIVIGVLSPASAASVGIGASQNDWINCGTTQNGAFAYNNPDIGAYYSDGEHKRAIADCTETIRLDPTDPDAHFNRGTKNQAKSDLNQIIVYYNAAISRDPKDDDAYFHRGLAHFYAGALQQAAADLSQASKLDPEYAFYALWMDIIEKRGNLASHLPQAISHINMTKWPAPVIRLFLGQASRPLCSPPPMIPMPIQLGAKPARPTSTAENLRCKKATRRKPPAFSGSQLRIARTNSSKGPPPMQSSERSA
jgi:Tetratricopeptide repeat